MPPTGGTTPPTGAALASGRPPREPIDPSRIGVSVPSHVRRLLATLWENGHAAYVVGGSLRDALLDRPALDWDVATGAPPDQLLALFPGSHYENRFGTVLVATGERSGGHPIGRTGERSGGHPIGRTGERPGKLRGETPIEVTTFRSDHSYADHRRPDAVVFTDSLELDLGRRDFTVNALAWGCEGGPTGTPELIDLIGGVDDLEAGVIRAVGDPVARFDEDALRLVRAARLAGQLDFTIEPVTRDAMERTADRVRHVSPERIGQELRKLLGGDRPSRGLRILADTGLLERVLPELTTQRGLPQAKAPGADCWEHTLATVDAAAALRPDRTAGKEHRDAGILVAAALFHDAGKPRALAGGRFPDHEEIGADITEHVLRRLAFPRTEIVRVVRLVRNHMFNYDSSWSDAAVRRFVQRVGSDLWEDLLLLRGVDAAASGGGGADAGLSELRRRIERELGRGFPLDVRELAVDGDDLRRELGLPEGPVIGRLLSRLLESCTADPSRNTRKQALVDAQSWLPDLLCADGPGGDSR